MPLTLTAEQSEQEIRTLIDERRRRNDDYYRIFRRLKKQFWKEIVKKIKEDTGTDFTGTQCKEKFKNMVRDCKVSKLL